MRASADGPRWDVLIGLTTIVVAMVLAGGPALAKNCGGVDPPCGSGRIACACGDTVTASYVITSTLDCRGYSGPYGLKIASGVAFTMGATGVSIIGNNVANSIGILFDGASGSSVKGMGNESTGQITDWLVVTGWERGIQLTNGASNNTVQWVLSQANVGGVSGVGDYGIDLRVGANNNVIRYSTITGNLDEGVHFGGGSYNNTLDTNSVYLNTNVQVYLTDTTGTTVRNNFIYGLLGGTGGVRVNSTTYSIVDSNDINNSSILLDNGAAYNTLTNNSLNAAGRIQFNTDVHDNVVSGLTVNTTDDHCAEFSSNSSLPYANRLTSSDLHCTGTQREIISEGSGTAHGQNYVCATTCRNSSGGTRNCVDPGTSTDDVRDDAHIITLQTAPCP